MGTPERGPSPRPAREGRGPLASRPLAHACGAAIGWAAIGWAALACSVATSTASESSRAADVPWLAEVSTPPAQFPRQPAGPLRDLTVDATGRPIESREAWQRERARLEQKWRQFLGPMPADPRPENHYRVIREDRDAGVIRQLVEYEGEPGWPVQGYLLRPLDHAADNKADNQPTAAEGTVGDAEPPRRPGVVVLHGTSPHSIETVAGLAGPESRWIGLHLCQRGFVVFCPRCFLWQDAENYQAAVDRHRARHPETLGMTKMLYDAQRGVDLLASLPDVDAKRLGAAGHSLGAKEALYLAAFDSRIQAAVASEGGIGLTFTNWDAPWYLGPVIHEEDFPRNHHELLALIAPRPFLILAGESGPGAADGDRTWPLVEAALPIYRLEGRPPRLGIFNHRAGHDVPPEALERLTEWLETYLEAPWRSP